MAAGDRSANMSPGAILMDDDLKQRSNNVSELCAYKLCECLVDKTGTVCGDVCAMLGASLVGNVATLAASGVQRG
jgi:hypothetical protein